jgi:hypothetical protein
MSPEHSSSAIATGRPNAEAKKRSIINSDLHIFLRASPSGRGKMLIASARCMPSAYAVRTAIPISVSAVTVSLETKNLTNVCRCRVSLRLCDHE